MRVLRVALLSVLSLCTVMAPSVGAQPKPALVYLAIPDDGVAGRLGTYLSDVQAGIAYTQAVQMEEVRLYVLQVEADELAAYQAELARQQAAARTYVRSTPSGGGGSGDCSNPIVSESVARRESGCNWDAQSPPSFCGGRGCTGFYQLDNGHFYATSPWNSNVSGSCYGLNPSTREGQTECASRIGAGAWG